MALNIQNQCIIYNIVVAIISTSKGVGDKLGFTEENRIRDDDTNSKKDQVRQTRTW